MDINWLEILLYGFVAGLTEFLPVSAQAHQTVLLNLFGFQESHPILELFVHCGMLCALIFTSAGMIRRTLREYKASRSARRRKKRNINMQPVLDMRFVKAAIIPFLLSFVLYNQIRHWSALLPVVAVCLLVNGLILHIPMYMARGNKDSRNMTGIDGVFFGIVSALWAFPGISRVGVGASAAVTQGASPQNAFRWCLLLSVPALAGILCFDLLAVFSVGAAGLGAGFIAKSIVSGLASFAGGYISVSLVKSLLTRSDFTGFSYYCWGAALFAFILYLY